MLSLPDLVVGAAGRHRAVTVLPLFTPVARPPLPYRLGGDAVAAGVLEIHELDGGGAVDRLIARNRGSDRVLLLEGDHLIGAKQNRVLTSSAVVGGKRKLTLPVSCVEQGRWQATSSRFSASATMAPAGVRRILKLSVTQSLVGRAGRVADQSRIWGQIAEQQRRLRVTSATCALSHSYLERAGDVSDVSSRLPYVERATGLAIGIGDEVISVDLFDKPETCAFYWRRLVDGAALEAIGRPGGGGIGDTEVQRLVDQLRAAAWTPVAPVGDGEEHRAGTPDAAASALVLDGQLIHFGLATTMASAGAAAVQSAPRPMRRDLPAALAGRYTIVARIGVGGAKEVFRATDGRDGRDVAIARVPAVDPEEFAREVELARRVRGRYVPEIYESFVDDCDDGYLVMEYCDGKSLAKLAERPLAIAEAAPIMVELARAVASIHQAHVLHRDIKLENVLLCTRGDRAELKVLDFGVSARARSETTATSIIINVSGTLPYMAREALRGGHSLDARTDVYAFGVCCYRLLVGELPVLPGEHETRFEYVHRLSQLERHDLSRLPALPPPARELIARMLEPDRELRPFMPEVVAGFERAFGDPPLAARGAPAPAPPPSDLVRIRHLAIPITAPGQLVVAPCAEVPLIALVPDGEATTLRALGADGTLRWSRRVEHRLTAGLRADLDGDGVRELYVAGPGCVLGLDAAGTRRFDRAVAGDTAPGLLAIPDRVHPRLAADGRLLDPRTGHDTGPILYAYEGNGSDLVAATSLHGVSYNGFAMQAFRGSHATGAAIIGHPGEREFQVAHLEERRRRVQLVIYGPGGTRVHALPVAEHAVPTGDLAAIAAADRPLFGPEHAPIVLAGRDGTAVVIVSLAGAHPLLSTRLVAFALPSGRELWRIAADATTRPAGHALLADLDGTGKPQLVVGDGAAITAYDPWTGVPTRSFPCAGLPIACGDPFASGFAHLVTASSDGIELWRGARCQPGTMQWIAPRADLWHTGALRSTGQPYGPV